MNEPVLEWLLEGDIAIRFQRRRDLLHCDDVHLQNRIAREGEGAALLASRHADGCPVPDLVEARKGLRTPRGDSETARVFDDSHSHARRRRPATHAQICGRVRP
jgi:hypothetical protein